VKRDNIEKVHGMSMSLGKQPKERMSIPDGVEVFMYGN
jgi:hypothetical protein